MCGIHGECVLEYQQYVAEHDAWYWVVCTTGMSKRQRVIGKYELVRTYKYICMYVCMYLYVCMSCISECTSDVMSMYIRTCVQYACMYPDQ